MTKSPLSIIDAMDDPALFAPWFPGNTWDAWRTVLKAAFGLPMTEDDLAFFRTVAEREPPPHRVKELWIIVGRRGGKDSVASVIAAYIAAMFEDKDHRIRPGERPLVVNLAVDREQSKIILEYTRSYFNDINMLQGMVSNETVSGFELTNGIDVTVTTNSFRSVRGRAVLVAIMDEVAFWRDDTSASPDTETYNALKPGLASLPGSMLVGISTPYAKAGLLYKKYKDHFGKDSADVLVIKAPTRTFNPTIDQSIIDEAMADDPAVARAEWFADFRSDVGSYLPAETIESAVDIGVTVRPPRPGVRYFGFVDAASGTGKDSFAIGISHVEGDKVILDVAHEIRPPFNPSSATAEAADLFKAYGIDTVTGDKYAAGYNIEAFRRCGISYQYSERDRSEIYIECVPLFTSGRLRLTAGKRLFTQFATLERRTSVTGRDQVDHGRGEKHDDVCNAAAGSIVLAARGNSGPGMGILEYYRRLSEETKAERKENTVAEAIEHKLTVPAGTSNVTGQSGRSYFVTDGTITVTDYDAKSLLLIGFREFEPAEISAPEPRSIGLPTLQSELSNGG